MTRNTLIAAILSLFIVAPAAAQEQRGSIQGFVKDSSGAVLPGVTVEARSPALVGGATDVTDSDGGNRFTSLTPGVYYVDAELLGCIRAENHIVIDCVDQTDLRQGTAQMINLTINSPSKTVANDFVEQVQVKASGYNAEYRAAIGGVISAITKSGGNQWRGGAGVYFTSDKL